MTIASGKSNKMIGFRAKVLTSTKMSGIRFASDFALRFASTIVLTRLLAPEIYGVFAVVLLYMYLLELFSDVGLRSLILTKEGEVGDGFLRSCWSISILRGLVIALFSALIAAVIALLQGQGVFSPDSPYAEPLLAWVIVSLGGATFVLGLQSPMVYMRERDMKFGRVTIVYVVTNVIGLIVTIALAYYLRSIWALVLGHAAKCTIQVVMSFIFFPGPAMRFDLNREDIGLVIDRGKWIIGHSVLYALSNSADRLVLGFVMTSSTFGFYFIARQLVDLVARFLMSIDAQMGIQVFTHLQKSQTAQFRRNYYRYRLFFDVLAGLSVGMGFVLAPLLVEIIYDDRYAGVASILQVLIWGMLLIGPILLRSAFMAERLFRQATLLGLLSTCTIWIGLGIAIFVFDSVEVALVVIALHRLPEAMVVTVLGGDRDWVIIWREFLSFGFCMAGILAGWGMLMLWDVLT